MSSVSAVETPVEPRASLQSVSAPEFRLISDSELHLLPKREWLVRGMLWEHSLAVLYGPPGTGKSFFALDLSLSIAAGQPFLGYPVNTGRTVYIAAEGQYGLLARVAAWKRDKEIARIENWSCVPMPVLVQDPLHLRGLLKALSGQSELKLIVLDTTARCFDGDENSSRDMGTFIRAVDHIRFATGASVLLLHHPGKGGGQERGHSALRGAADTMLSLGKSRGRLVLHNDKEKDEAQPKDIALTLVPAFASCVLRLADIAMTSEKLRSRERIALTGLRYAVDKTGMPVTHGDWQEATGLSESTFDRARKTLTTLGIVEQHPDGGYALVAPPSGLSTDPGDDSPLGPYHHQLPTP